METDEKVMWVEPGDHEEHLDILIEAHSIYVKRDAVRGDMWRQFPPSDKLRMIREKLERAEAAYARFSPTGKVQLIALRKEYEDSLLDLINFAVFGIRQVREGASG